MNIFRMSEGIAWVLTVTASSTAVPLIAAIFINPDWTRDIMVAVILGLLAGVLTRPATQMPRHLAEPLMAPQDGGALQRAFKRLTWPVVLVYTTLTEALTTLKEALRQYRHSNARHALDTTKGAQTKTL